MDMKTFLQTVAEDLYNKIGAELAETAVVFPNKRAGLFFNEHLARHAGKPVWAPAVISISDLFKGLSPLQVGDSIRLVCELHKVYQDVTGSDESLDDFYFWGELLISDFDDADKNLVEADKLFNNLQNLQELDGDYSFLTPEQVEAIRHFFSGFSIEQPTELKEKFASIWNHLGSLYHRYRARLQEAGIAYEGMLYRTVTEQLDVALLPYKHYIFVGFNVLNQVERTLFRKLREAGMAMFYWDYDCFYLSRNASDSPRHEAGEFIRRNLQDFPNELEDASLFNTLGQPKQVRYVAAATENAQARYLSQWIDAGTWNPDKEKEHAVVLCDESLLLPVIHSVPSCVHNINITMGFPLSGTPVSGFINALMDLQTEGYDTANGRFRHEAVALLLRHPYTLQLSKEAARLSDSLIKRHRFFPTLNELHQDDFLTRMFTPRQGTRALCAYLVEMLEQVTQLYRPKGEEEMFSQLYRESLFKSYTLVNRLLSLTDEGTLDINPHTLRRLLNRLVSAAGIPFHGEPAIGMQVMGVLETRNLDFRHVLMLSVNEGKLPQGKSEASFIPYNLRKAFGMTTIDHRISVFAYYFYRLLQRAETITLLYNTSTEGMNRGEMSRFMQQFLIDWPHPIVKEYLDAEQKPHGSSRIEIAKTPEIISRLCNRFDAANAANHTPLSPSALNTYIDCPLKFYFKYVAGLKVPDEMSEDIDNSLFGTLYHDSAQHIYEDLTKHNPQVLATDIERLMKDEVRLQTYVDNAFKTKFFRLKEDEKSQYNGIQLINFDVIKTYITRLLSDDKDYAPFSMEGMEQNKLEVFRVETPSGQLSINIGGVIDRMDLKGDTLRIIDYKTGKEKDFVPSIESLFTPSEKRNSHVFQTFLYACIMSGELRRQGKSLRLKPVLYYITKTGEPLIEIGQTPIDDFANQVETEFREHLQKLLNDIFNPENSFTQTPHEKNCQYCDFKQLCRKGSKKES